MKNSFYYCFALLFCSFLSQCQPAAPFARMADMPMAITNNALCGITIDNKEYVYSFGGLGKNKTHEDITLRSFKYDVQENLWSEIAALPDTMGKVAAAANVIKGKIYIVGGYYVFPDGHEKSSPNVHVYDPTTDTYLPDAANIPTPIDDQVQTVWRDSLLYVITGWSDSLNVKTVQMYEPEENTWQYANPLPEEYSYAVFGSSGVIVNNTIYYMGGAGNRQNKNFPIQSILREGKIDPSNPLNIKWSSSTIENAGIYRSAAFLLNGQASWINGAELSYNYNGIAYTGPPVDPLQQIIQFDSVTRTVITLSQQVPQVMDLRGAAIFSDKIIIAGGMLPNQVVSQQTFIIYPR